MNIKVRKIIYEIFERIAIKAVLHLLKVSATFPSFLISQLVSHGFDKLIVPLIDHLIRTGQLHYDYIDGKIKAKALRKAKDAKNEDAYNRAIDDIFQ